MYTWRAKIALISHVGENMEHAFHIYAPDGVSFSSTKLAPYAAGREDEALREVKAAAALFRGYDVDVIACGAEFALAASREGFDEACLAGIRKAGDLPAVTGASAALEALRKLGCGKAAVLAPYGPDGLEASVRYLEGRGVQVTAACGMDMTQFDRERLPYETAGRDFLYQYARSLPLEGAEAVFICGESLGTMEIIDFLERDIGLPVITSQQALFHAALRAGGVNAKIPSLGKLMTL